MDYNEIINDAYDKYIEKCDDVWIKASNPTLSLNNRKI